jgi:UDP-N-acetylglucosamine:LPS N-acetylglucosamine transferase
MYQWMNCADIVLSKWWPATIFEILSLEKILLIYSYVWQQEIGNIEFVKKNQLWVFQKDYHYIPWMIHGLLYDKKLQNKFKSNIRKLKYYNGLKEIISFIVNYSILQK